MPVLARAAPDDSVNLPGAVADQETEVRCAVTEVHQEVADLLGGPRAVRVRGDPEDVHVAGTELDHEQAAQALKGHRAVHVEEIGGEHGRSLGVQELPPCRVGVPFRRRGILRVLRTRRMVDALTRWPSFSSSPWIRWYPQLWFSVASRSMSMVISAPTGGRPVRCG
jgi:hypothetical protein